MDCFPEPGPQIDARNLFLSLKVHCPQRSPKLLDPSPDDPNWFIRPSILGSVFWTGLCGSGSGGGDRGRETRWVERFFAFWEVFGCECGFGFCWHGGVLSVLKLKSESGEISGVVCSYLKLRWSWDQIDSLKLAGTLKQKMEGRKAKFKSWRFTYEIELTSASVSQQRNSLHKQH